jgi:hypothetical protein
MLELLFLFAKQKTGFQSSHYKSSGGGATGKADPLREADEMRFAENDLFCVRQRQYSILPLPTNGLGAEADCHRLHA